jgi:hypothetical protein
MTQPHYDIDIWPPSTDIENGTQMKVIAVGMIE